MSKTNNIIKINGQHYDAVTGVSLSSGEHVKPSVRIPITEQARPHTSPAKKRHVSRQPARHHVSHPPTASRTLMRQAVKKPRPALKHRIKAQGHTDMLLQQALPTITPKPSLLQVDEKRLRHAKRVAKSRLISRFSPSLTSAEWTAPPAAAAASHPQTAAHRIPTAAKPAARQNPTEELLEHALKQATSYRELPPAKHRRLRLKRHAGAGL